MLRRHVLGCLLALVAGVLLAPAARAAEPFRYQEGKHGKGELRYVNGLPVLTVEGTPEEIGEQIGRLTAKPLGRLLGYSKQFLDGTGLGKVWPFAVKVSKSMLPQFPAGHRRELEAITKFSGLDFDLAVVGNTFADIGKIAGCSTLIVEPSRSATKEMLFGRNLDYPTMGFLQDYSLVTVYRPRGKHAFVSVGFPGLVGCVSGMNDAGLALATLEVYASRDGAAKLDIKGVPYALCFRRILEECATVTEAEKLLRSLRRTTMNNLAICDTKTGAVFEFTPKSLVVRRADRGICPCANHFCTKELGLGNTSRRQVILERSQELPTLGLADMAKKMDAVNQGEMTLQTMVFEPAALRLHLAIGKCPTSRLPLRELDLAPLLKKKTTR
jgi:hypothetical protein